MIQSLQVYEFQAALDAYHAASQHAAKVTEAAIDAAVLSLKDTTNISDEAMGAAIACHAALDAALVSQANIVSQIFRFRE
jgi:hypothetical protein